MAEDLEALLKELDAAKDAGDDPALPSVTAARNAGR